MSFLSRQQIQYQADAEGLWDTGYSQSAEQQCSDSVVSKQINNLFVLQRGKNTDRSSGEVIFLFFQCKNKIMTQSVSIYVQFMHISYI